MTNAPVTFYTKDKTTKETEDTIFAVLHDYCEDIYGFYYDEKEYAYKEDILPLVYFLQEKGLSYFDITSIFKKMFVDIGPGTFTVKNIDRNETYSDEVFQMGCLLLAALVGEEEELYYSKQ